MRILRLHVENFGALHDFDDSFDAGLNERLCPNGWGKTTLAAFVKAMLYGLPVSTVRSLLENERKRYTPWQGGAFGGSMDIEVDGKSYRIERLFGTKGGEDQLSVTSLESGLLAEVPWADDPGIGLFGVDAAAYERSTHLSSQHPVKDKAGLDSIHAKLNHLSDAIDDLADCQTAIDALEQRRRVYVHMKGNNGLLAREEERLCECDAKITECRARLEQLEKLRCSIRETRERADEIARRLRTLSEEQQKAIAVQDELRVAREYARMEAEAQEIRARQSALLSELGGEIPDEEMIGRLRKVTERREHLRRRLDEVSRMSDEKTPEEEGRRYPREWGAEDAELLRAAAQRYERAALRAGETEQSAAARERYDRLKKQLGERIPDDREWQKWRALCRLADDGQAEPGDASGGTSDVFRGTGTRSDARRGAGRLWWLPAAVLGGVSLVLTVLCVVRRELLYIGAAGLAVAAVLALVAGLHRGRVRRRQAEQAQARRENREQVHALLRRFGVSLAEEESAGDALEALQRRFAEYAVLSEENRREQQRRAREEQELTQAYEDWKRRFAALSSDPPPRDRVRDASEKLIYEHDRWLSQRREAQQCARELSDADATLRDLLKNVPICPREGGNALLWMTGRRQSALECREELKRKEAAIASYAAEHPMSEERREALREMPSPDLEASERARSECSEEQRLCAEELARLCQQEERMSAAEDEQIALEDDRAACAAHIAQIKDTVRALENARDYLERAREQLSTRYLSAMQTQFGVYMASVTGDEAPVFTIDTDLNVKLRAAGAGRDTTALSMGERDLVTLCMRLALVDAMFAREHPFLILDDPFVNLDDGRAARARALLDTLAARYQILYLTCSESRF